MKYLNSIISCILVSLLASCNSNDEPVNPPEYRISWIHFDESYQSFDYNADGYVSKWEYNDTPFHYTASYSYPESENMILITAEEQIGEDTWSYDEKLYLNPNGTASHAKGIATLKNNGELLMKKNFTMEFQYNSSGQLIKVNTAEKRTNDTGWEEPTSLEWCAEIEWQDNDLVRYSEYSYPEYPTLAKTFAYFGAETTHYLPIVQGPVVRRYYLPLQYQGVLGKLSVSLVKTMEVTSNQSLQKIDFSYDISASVYNSWIEGYTELKNGKETKYTIGWEEI